MFLEFGAKIQRFFEIHKKIRKKSARRLAYVQFLLYLCSGIMKSIDFKLEDVFAPKLFQTLRNYGRAQFAQDALAGVIVGIVAIPLAIVNAATVLAAGYAQVRAMNAVPVGGSGGSGAMVSAPTAPVAEVRPTATYTGASEVDRINESVKNIRAYVVESDITSKQTLHRRRLAEASF